MPRLGGDAHQLGQQVRRPGLVGVGDQARVRAGGAHLAHAPVVARPAELELEQRQAARGGSGGLGRHRLGGVEAQRVGGGERAQPRTTGEFGAPWCRRAWPRSPTARNRARCGRRRRAAVAAGRRGWSIRGCASMAAQHRCRPFRRSGHRARIRRGPSTRPSLTRATTTTASRLAPREMANVPAIGQVSTVASTLSAMGFRAPIAKFAKSRRSVPSEPELLVCSIENLASVLCLPSRPTVPRGCDSEQAQRSRPLAWARNR